MEIFGIPVDWFVRVLFISTLDICFECIIQPTSFLLSFSLPGMSSSAFYMWAKPPLILQASAETFLLKEVFPDFPSQSE